MSRRSMDARMKKTKQALVNAMIELLSQQPFSAITVNDICSAATVGRSTFYTHFQDKYALVRYAIEQMKDTAHGSLASMSLSEHIEHALTQVKKHASLLKNLTATEFNSELMDLVRTPFCDEMERALLAHKAQGNTVVEPIEMTAVYYAFAMSSTIMYWVHRDMPYSVEEMAHCLNALIPREILEITRRMAPEGV